MLTCSFTFVKVETEPIKYVIELVRIFITLKYLKIKNIIWI
ncbi:hypothetical protein SAMN06265346_10628 [Flavobacterium hercynium]|nr:hypothetical protein SAMN06265346_10628 [Flavobacterium hercynium]